MGGAFGGKIDLFSHEYCAALLSMKASRPVKIVATREEIFTAYRHGQPLLMELKTGVKSDGTLMAQQIKVINNSGAYRGSGIVVVFLSWGFGSGRIEYAISVPRINVFYTNNPVPSP